MFLNCRRGNLFLLISWAEVTCHHQTCNGRDPCSFLFYRTGLAIVLVVTITHLWLVIVKLVAAGRHQTRGQHLKVGMVRLLVFSLIIDNKKEVVFE